MTDEEIILPVVVQWMFCNATSLYSDTPTSNTRRSRIWWAKQMNMVDLIT